MNETIGALSALGSIGGAQYSSLTKIFIAL